MSRSIAGKSRLMRPPTHIAELQPTVARVEQMLLTRLAREPTAEEVHDETGLSTADVDLVRNSRREPVSLSSPIGDDDDRELGDTIVDVGGDSHGPEFAGEAAWLRRAMSRAMAELSERERAVVRLRFGLDDGGLRTFAAVGRELGVTREAVRLIEARAFKKLAGLADVQRLRAD